MPGNNRFYYLFFLLALTMVVAQGASLFSRYAIQVDLTIPDRDFPDSGSVHGLVCSVLGDPLPGVSVSLANKHTVTGEAGDFFFQRILMGDQLIRLECDGYQTYSRRVKIDAGTNSLEFKYDSGLFPTTFVIDFHIFYTASSIDQGRCFGEIGFANGSGENYYLTGLVIYNPLGVEVINLLRTEDDFREITGTLSDSNFVAKPKMAVLVKPGEVFRVNLPPLANPITEAVYTLKCIFSSQKQWEASIATMEVQETVCKLDDDWNPHT